MSLHRIFLFAAVALSTAAMTSAASAQCCDRGIFTSAGYAATGCGGCGTPSAAIVYAEPVAPVPPPVPVVVNTYAWGSGCGCQRPVVYAAPSTELTPIAPAPIYVVNQGPDYTGPGIMVPYRTWNPAPLYAPPSTYPYVPGYGYGYGYGDGYRIQDRRVAYRWHSHPYRHYHQ
jgi:hypothetical protein